MVRWPSAAKWLRAKYFPVRPDQSQSASIYQTTFIEHGQLFPRPAHINLSGPTKVSSGYN